MKTADQMMLELQTVFEQLKTGEMEQRLRPSCTTAWGR